MQQIFVALPLFQQALDPVEHRRGRVLVGQVEQPVEHRADQALPREEPADGNIFCVASHGFPWQHLVHPRFRGVADVRNPA